MYGAFCIRKRTKYFPALVGKNTNMRYNSSQTKEEAACLKDIKEGVKCQKTAVAAVHLPAVKRAAKDVQARQEEAESQKSR